jgi:hypothetical protein
VAFATEQLYHVNGTPRQDWIPPILVDNPATEGSDPIMARGLSKLRNMIASASRRHLAK